MVNTAFINQELLEYFLQSKVFRSICFFQFPETIAEPFSAQNKVLGCVAHTQIRLWLPLGSVHSPGGKRHMHEEQRTAKTQQNLESDMGEGQGILGILRKEMGLNLEALALVVKEPLSWDAEDRQNLDRRTQRKGSPGRGRNVDKGKDAGQQDVPTHLAGVEGRICEGKKQKMRQKTRWEVVKESLHLFVVHSC